MKRLLFLFMFPLLCFGQKTYVPDNGFENNLISQGLDNVMDDSVLTSNISGLTNFYTQNAGIQDLTGIEDFTSLEYLDVPGSYLSSLDLSNNTSLIWLNISGNNLTNLDLSTNTNLEGLNCDYNLLTSLDLSNNQNLILLKFWGNQIDSININGLTNLETILSGGLNPLTNIVLNSNTCIKTIIVWLSVFIRGIGVVNKSAFFILERPKIKIK